MAAAPKPVSGEGGQLALGELRLGKPILV